MPVYEYVCTACGARVEVVHGIYDAGPAMCTACGGRVRKAVSAPAIVFRGTGWAKKDAQKAAASRASGDRATAGPDAGESGRIEKETGTSKDAGTPKETGTSGGASPTSGDGTDARSPEATKKASTKVTATGGDARADD